MTARAVCVVTEVAPIGRAFDYLVTDTTAQAAEGDRVRIDFNNRSVRGWVVGEAVATDELKALTKWLGFGPPPSMMGLLTWASERWYSPLSRFLAAASPKRLVTSLPTAPLAPPLAPSLRDLVQLVEPGVREVAPTTDPLALILGAYEMTRTRQGSLLVLVPTEAWASRLRGRLEQRGLDVASGESQWDRMRAGWPVVVGARGVALAPVPHVSGAVVVDADDESYRCQGAPTWDAVTLLRERCARDGAPLWCTSTIPSPTLLDDGGFASDNDVAAGWPRVEVVDRRASDPHDGVLARSTVDACHRALQGDEAVAVVIVLQRLGSGRLFACRTCGELARCHQCAQGEEEVDGQLSCRDRHELRANFCRSCGATNLKKVRVGVTTLARDVAAQLAQPVVEVTGASDATEVLTRVVVGTEAVWQRVRRCALVVFVDFDQYLLAPRDSARRRAITAVGKAGRLVGSRREGRGEVLVQTRRGEDQVLEALVSAHFAAVIDDEVDTARLLRLAPYGAWAEVSGEGAAQFIEALDDEGVEVMVQPKGYFLVAPDVVTLTRVLRATPRPAERVRVAVQ